MLRLFTATTMLLFNLFVAGQLSAQTLIVLNDDNGGMDLLESGVFMVQASAGGSVGDGPISGINLEYSCGTCDVADFSDAQPIVGGGRPICGYKRMIPISIVQNDDQLCVRSTISPSKWDIDLLTFKEPTFGCTENPLGGCAISDGFTSYLRTAFPAPSDLLESLISDVMNLNIKMGIANSLDAKINTALQALDDMNVNNDVAAINALQAFINAVQAQRGNHISDEDAKVLIANAQAIIDLLNT